MDPVVEKLLLLANAFGDHCPTCRVHVVNLQTWRGQFPHSSEGCREHGEEELSHGVRLFECG